MISVSKYHGCGNDFIITTYAQVQNRNIAKLAIELNDRYTGIGADGFIVVKTQPLEMVFYNCDGSQAPMCGNGIRCFAAYVYDEGIIRDTCYDVKTLAGMMHIQVISTDPFLVEINMGKASDDPILLHTQNKQSVVDYKVEVEGIQYELTSLFMGTIHTVVYVEDVNAPHLERVGCILHQLPIFQEKTNINFIKVIDRTRLQVKTYERGVGMTKACGTGCCAALRDAHRKGLVDAQVEVELEKGVLQIRMLEDETIMMCGPAQCIMRGTKIK